MLDRPKCPHCGGRTYTFGKLLPGQSPIRADTYDDRERDRWACVKCEKTGPTVSRKKTP